MKFEANDVYDSEVIVTKISEIVAKEPMREQFAFFL